MEIKDAIGIYQFLGDIDTYGAVGICILFFVVFFLGTSAMIKSLPDKLVLSKAIKILPVLVASLVLFSVFFLRIDAVERAEKLKLANQVKAYLSSNHYRLAGLRRIQNGIKFSDKEKLIGLTKLYPSEFQLVFNINDPKDSVGIKLVDPVLLKEIDTFEKEMASILRAGLKNYMCRGCHMGYNEIIALDVRYNKPIIELVIQLYPEEFAPYLRNDTIKRL